MLSDGYDQRSSLDISIMLSFTSSRMTSGAQDLLSVLSMLPDGLSDTDLVQTRLPIPDILACKSTLIRTSLAFIDKDQRLNVLVPFREHVFHVHPPTEALKIKLHQYLHELLDLWNQFRHVNPVDIFPKISHNLGNFNSVLLDALLLQNPEDTRIIKSILFLNRFYDMTQMSSSPLFPILTEKMTHWEHNPMFGDYLVEHFNSVKTSPVIDAQSQIVLGNDYFKSKGPLEQANWYFALGTYAHWEQSQMAHAPDLYDHALHLSDSTGCPTTIGARALAGIATVMYEMENPSGALKYAKKAEIYGMNNFQNTLRWAAIFISLGLISKTKLATMKAIHCLGKLLAAEGDDESAFSLFTVALEAFTFMDVHCWRADCMVQIADIYEKRGEIQKSVGQWKMARPLFERSSQAKDVTRLDRRLAEADFANLGEA
ncbi:hypothetical protein C8J57DRAFT_1642867 [Mycena rebaudengoi]|nr:hypothetical protein C8J57DRAFT_1642867 [Mycena rebaudengoi]